MEEGETSLEENLEEEHIEDIELEAKYVTQKIQELIKSNYQVYDAKKQEFRPIKYKDIAILLRSTKTSAPIYEKELTKQDIPVYSDSGAEYLGSIEIQTILSLLKIIDMGKIKSEKQKKVLQFLKENEGVTVPEIEMFTGGTRAIVKTLEKNGYVEIIEKKVERNPLAHKDIEKTENLKLTEEQQNAFDTISTMMKFNEYEQFLLYGVTGSGKTEVYLQLIGQALKQNKTAIVLVPEISLTPQMIDRFIARFNKDEIAVLHSKLSIGERYDEWNKIKENKAKIIIGARSAIFAPTENIGIIIIDEEHDSSYKSEAVPKYDAKEIAKKIAKENNCPLVLGSATPDLVTYYKACEEKIALLELTKRANNSKLPDVEIVDLKMELANGNRSMLSVDLYNAIEKNLKEKRQTILFLNRRGYSTFIMCRECGYTVKCKNCDISLTYHKTENKLKCHYCGYEEKLVTLCPECQSTKIRYFGTGTQRLEQEINKIFPQASTIRMDIDTVTKKNSHEEILNTFRDDGIDILIGTQMVVKGHHFPNVTLVGVIAADSSLNIEGKECVVVGRSNIVGKPMALLLLRENGTVTITHSRTKDLKEVTKRADILVAAIGKPKFITSEYVKEGAVVIDVGIHRNADNKLCGDVDFDDVVNKVAAITPVPGGVGPMTIAMLMNNCVETVREIRVMGDEVLGKKCKEVTTMTARTLAEIFADLKGRGLQPVMADYVFV